MSAWTKPQLITLLGFINGPRRKQQILRPRPCYLPHPWRRLPRVRGVLKISGWGCHFAYRSHLGHP